MRMDEGWIPKANITACDNCGMQVIKECGDTLTGEGVTLLAGWEGWGPGASL